MTEVDVQLEFTPNPDTLKYLTSVRLLAAGAKNFASLEAAKGASPLATKLFELGDISAIMIGTNFITVTLKSQERIAQLNDQITHTLKTFLSSSEPVILMDALKADTQEPIRTEIEQKIIKILDEEVRPAVAMDGGDISFEKFEDGYVYLRMQGSCSGCPSSMMTLKMGVETRLKSAIPEIQEVIPV